MFDSVLAIPLYNNKEYLEKALDSININGINSYILICNDCSTEDVETILFTYFTKYNKYDIIIDNDGHTVINNKNNKLHYMKHWKNRNITITRFDLIDYAYYKLHCKYIMWMDPDDWVQKDYYETLLNNKDKSKIVSMNSNRKWYLWDKLMDLKFIVDNIKDGFDILPYYNIGEDYRLIKHLLQYTNIYYINSNIRYCYNRSNINSITHKHR